MPEKKFILVHQDGGFWNVNDGSHWIRVSDPLAATVLTKTKADNILLNMIKPSERTGWSVQPLPSPAVKTTPKPSVHRRQRPASVAEAEEEKEKTALLDEWLIRAEEFKTFYESLLKRKQALIEELRNVSAELCDIEHYIEFTTLSVSEGQRTYRLLKERLLRRRRIKDELLCISIFLKAEPRSILNGSLSRQIAGLATREYGPRVLSDLFQDGQ